MSLVERRRALMMEKGSPGKSDMNGWTDGVPYTDLQVFANQYYETNGTVKNYTNWSRTGYIPCNGASTLSFTQYPVAGIANYNCFFTETKQFISSFNINGKPYNPSTVKVPPSAYYFGVSSQTSALQTFLSSGRVIPYR